MEARKGPLISNSFRKCCEDQYGKEPLIINSKIATKIQ